VLLEPDYLLWEDTLRDDLLLEVGDGGVVLGAPPKGTPGAVRRLPGRLLLPGLVNAHSHAFQRLIRGCTEYVAAGALADDFWSWRELMYRAAESLTPEEVYASARQVFVEMARAGITTVGEFHYLHHAPDGTRYEDPHLLSRAVVRAAREVGLRVVLLRVAYARAGYQKPGNPRQRRFLDATPDAALEAVASLRQGFQGDPAVSVGLAPHSVRAVPAEWLREFARLPDAVPLHMHVAEQPAEVVACNAEHGVRPVQLLQKLGLLRPNFTAVHGIHLAADEIDALGRAHATVCACPSTERNLGDGVVPADALLRAGAHLALGSDSQAHVDLLMEMRQLDGHLRLLRLRRAVLDPGLGQPSGLALRLLQLATVGGARSLGLPVGRLAVGAPADFFTVDVDHPSVAGVPADRLLSGVVFAAERQAVREVAVAGRFIVEEGQHPLQEAAVQGFRAVARRVFA
jgi:formimidoylglutamate deiminase